MGDQEQLKRPKLEEEGPDSEFIKQLEASDIPVEQIPEEDLGDIESEEAKNPEKIIEAKKELDAAFSDSSEDVESDKLEQELKLLQDLKHLMEERAKLLYQYQQADRITNRAIRIDSNDPNKDKKIEQLNVARKIVAEYEDIQDQIGEIEEKLKK